jgi:hypothetical protein
LNDRGMALSSGPTVDQHEEELMTRPE